MKKTLVAVIDDEMYDREEIYKAFLSENFDVLYIGNFAELSKIDNKVKLIVIDKSLIEWECTMQSVLDDSLKNYKDIPKIIVSKHWNDNNGRPIAEIRVFFDKYKNILDIFSWDEIANTMNTPQYNTTIKRWKDRIRLVYDLHQGQEMSPKSDNDSLRIVQLSDMQFGGKRSAGALGDRFAIGTYLRNSIKLHSTLIAVCGDITESGKPNEYDKALKWFEDFSETVWKKKDIKRFLFTVGNHDCNFSALAQFKYEYDFLNSNFKEINQDNGLINWEIENNELVTTEEIVFQNYLLFEEKYTPTSNSVWKTRHLNVVNDYFLNWGIRVIHLNTISRISPKNEKGMGADTEEIKRIIGYCTNVAKEPDVFTILISHNTPTDLGYRSSDSDLQDSWEDFKNLLVQINIKLWLCGHQHSFDIGEVEIGDCIIPYATTGSLRLDASKRAPNSNIGFNIIELKRTNGEIDKIEITAKKKEDSKLIDYKKKEFSC